MEGRGGKEGHHGEGRAGLIGRKRQRDRNRGRDRDRDTDTDRERDREGERESNPGKANIASVGKRGRLSQE
jgi:hypothetical protein